MRKLQKVSERRALRTASLTVIAGGRSLKEALEIAASMTPQQQKEFVERELARLGKSKIQFLAGQAGQVLGKIKDVLKGKQAAFDGMKDIKDPQLESTGPMAVRNPEPPSHLKQLLQRVSSVAGIAAVIILMGGAILGLFEPENRETITHLKPLLATFGAGAVSLISGFAASKIK